MSFGIKGGYSQSGGGYLIIISTIVPAQLNVYTSGSGSGGATTVGTMAAASSTELPNFGSPVTNISTFFTTGKLIKDMGRTVVSAGRTFRKVQAVVGTAGAADPSLGVNGLAPNYASFYLETGYEGAAATAGNLPMVVRYM
jgi:hypothetical protein